MMHEGDEFHESISDKNPDVVDMTGAATVVGEADNREPRKFFPRVKMLLSFDYEPLLKGLLQVVEASGCPHVPTATTTNEWQVAFDASYNTVLSDFSLPSGKNRYHKFRDKVVEIWKAMEDNAEISFDNNPLYTMAKRQHMWFSRAMNERKAMIGLDDRKQAPSSSHKDTSKAKAKPKSVPAATSTTTATPATSTKKRPAVGASPTTSPAIATTPLAPVGFATAARDIANSSTDSMDKSGWQEVLMSKLEIITVLLQTANNNPHMPPKLPILLNDLHRLRVRTTDPGELAIMKPYYVDLLNNYLQAIEYKIRADSRVPPHPAALLVDLEGMDLLRQGLRNDAVMLDMVQKTYRRVLMRYLKMVNPRIPAIVAKQKRPRET